MKNFETIKRFSQLIRITYVTLKTIATAFMRKANHLIYILFNPFPNTPFSDRPKLKEAAEDNWNVAIKGLKDTNYIENIVEKVKLLILNFTFFHNVCLKLFLQ